MISTHLNAITACAVTITTCLHAGLRNVPLRDQLKGSSRLLLSGQTRQKDGLSGSGDSGAGAHDELSYENLVETCSNINDGAAKPGQKFLGCGSSGDVYQINPKTVAKNMRVDLLVEDPLRFPMREIMLSRCLSHPNLTTITHVPLPKDPTQFTKTGVFCIMPLATELSQFLEDGNCINIPKVMFDVTKGLIYLHSVGVMHRDIKARNTLLELDSDGTVLRATICDFDLSRHPRGRKLSKGPGTAENKAPEVLAGTGKYTKTCDLWSLGCTLAKLLVGEILSKWVGAAEWKHRSKVFYGSYALFKGSEDMISKIANVARIDDGKAKQAAIGANQWKLLTRALELEELGTEETVCRQQAVYEQIVESILVYVVQNIDIWTPEIKTFLIDSGSINGAEKKVKTRVDSFKHDQVRACIKNKTKDLWENEGLDLLAQLLDHDRNRASAQKLLEEHPFFKSIRGDGAQRCTSNVIVHDNVMNLESEIDRLINDEIKKVNPEWDIRHEPHLNDDEKAIILYKAAQWKPDLTKKRIPSEDTKLREKICESQKSPKKGSRVSGDPSSKKKCLVM